MPAANSGGRSSGRSAAAARDDMGAAARGEEEADTKKIRCIILHGKNVASVPPRSRTVRGVDIYGVRLACCSLLVQTSCVLWVWFGVARRPCSHKLSEVRRRGRGWGLHYKVQNGTTGQNSKYEN